VHHVGFTILTLLCRVPITGTFDEHLSLVNGAPAKILGAFRFPPTVDKCDTSQRNHVRLFTNLAEMFVFPRPVCTRQRDKWPVRTISMTKLVERTGTQVWGLINGQMQSLPETA
jgi:hypothetical protein